MIGDAKKADPEADVSGLEAEIDQLVYSLYDLTREEIAIIEDSRQEETTSREVADDSELELETWDGTMKLPDVEKAEVPEAKVVRYLLSTTHR